MCMHNFLTHAYRCVYMYTCPCKSILYSNFVNILNNLLRTSMYNLLILTQYSVCVFSINTINVNVGEQEK